MTSHKRARAAHPPAAGMHQMLHTEDPKQKILNALGDIATITPIGMGTRTLGCNLLIATYMRPEKTQGGIITDVSTGKEDPFQSKVGLVVKIGAYSFQGDNEAKWGGDIPKLHEWVLFDPQRGLACSVRGVHCRVLQDVELDMIIENPDDVW